MTEIKHKRVGLYGGSFNPPHMAHVLAVEWVLASGLVDEVWVIPTGGHPFGKELAPFDERLQMCRLAFAPQGEKVKVLDIERGPGIHYSVDTVERLAGMHPGMLWRWMIGADAMAQSAEWKNFARLRELAPPLVIGRMGYIGASEGITLPDISSTSLRALIAKHADDSALAGLLPDNVLRHIQTRGLYRASCD